MSQIHFPKNCSVVALSDIAQDGNDKFTDGPFGSRLKVSDYTSSGVQLIRLQNVGVGIFYSKTTKFTSEKKYEELIRHSAIPGDIIIAKMADPVARACILPNLPGKFLIVADCVKLRTDEKKIIPKYLMYMINSPQVRKQAIEKSKGMTRLRINLSDIKKLKIPLPSLDTQRKTVKQLDYIFAQLEEKKKITSILKNKIERSVTVLHDQISGEIITRFYVSDKVVKNSKILKLSDVCNINPSKSEISVLNNNVEVTFVPMRAVDDVEGRIKTPEIRMIGEVKKGYTYFKENDVIFAKITPCMENGKAALCKGLKNDIGFGSTEFHVLRPKENVLPEWIYYFVRQNTFRKDAESVMKGSAGQQRVPVSFIESYLIPVPSLLIQNEIIEKIKKSTDIVNSLKLKISSILVNLKRINEYTEYLQDTILNKAFSGKLVN